MRNENQPFPVVGVGASAGGVAALEGFFRGVPENSGMTFVVITHLNPDRQSSLPEILARHTGMPVRAADNGDILTPNTVLVMSAGTLVTLENDRLRVMPQSVPNYERKPIDVFLGSLATARGEYAASVVLSGGDGDGSLGTQAVKEHGGLTLAQAPGGDGPQHPEMPRSAISTGFVDLAIPVEEMGAKLAEYFGNVGDFNQLPLRVDPTAATEPAKLHDEIFGILRKQIGHDFSGYKSKTFLRRVGRRMQVHQIRTIDAYVSLLRESPSEVTALFRDLLINVTTFFRDGEAFAKLADMVIPHLFENRSAQDAIRVWVPGCATGEEVYSLAILLREHMDRISAAPRVQIFGTDIDDGSLAIARSARYPEALLEGISEERRRRFFRLDGSSYVLTKEIRELCVFSPHSVIRDPPFSRLDLVSCRNLLIYLGAGAQKQVIPVFHYALRPGGYLFLGTSENVSQFTDLFTPIDKKSRIFRSRETGEGLARLPQLLTALPFAFTARPAPDRRQPTGISLRETVQTQVLERHAPPHVVVTRDGDIVHYSSRTGKYLEPPAGQPSRQLLSMARKELRLDLRAMLREAIEKNARVTREGLEVEAEEGRLQPLNLTIDPMPVAEASRSTSSCSRTPARR